MDVGTEQHTVVHWPLWLL